MADTAPPTIALKTSKSTLNSGSSALITFTLSELVTDFVLSDITYSGGVLSDFRGSGANYFVTFTPAVNSTTSGAVSVGNFKFSDSAGNANVDGTDLDNGVILAIDTISPKLTISSSSKFLGLYESATLTFLLSEPSNNFDGSDLVVTGGAIKNFSGSGTR